MRNRRANHRNHEDRLKEEKNGDRKGKEYIKN
jgi:hypothetical protein